MCVLYYIIYIYIVTFAHVYIRVYVSINVIQTEALESWRLLEIHFGFQLKRIQLYIWWPTWNLLLFEEFVDFQFCLLICWWFLPAFLREKQAFCRDFLCCMDILHIALLISHTVTEEEQLPAFLRDFGPNSPENLGFFLQRQEGQTMEQQGGTGTQVCMTHARDSDLESTCKTLFEKHRTTEAMATTAMACCNNTLWLVICKYWLGSKRVVIGRRWARHPQDHRWDSGHPRAHMEHSNKGDKVRQYNEVLNRIKEQLQQFLSM